MTWTDSYAESDPEFGTLEAYTREEDDEFNRADDEFSDYPEWSGPCDCDPGCDCKW